MDSGEGSGLTRIYDLGVDEINSFKYNSLNNSHNVNDIIWIDDVRVLIEGCYVFDFQQQILMDLKTMVFDLKSDDEDSDFVLHTYDVDLVNGLLYWIGIGEDGLSIYKIQISEDIKFDMIYANNDFITGYISTIKLLSNGSLVFNEEQMITTKTDTSELRELVSRINIIELSNGNMKTIISGEDNTEVYGLLGVCSQSGDIFLKRSNMQSYIPNTYEAENIILRYNLDDNVYEELGNGTDYERFINNDVFNLNIEVSEDYTFSVIIRSNLDNRILYQYDIEDEIRHIIVQDSTIILITESNVVEISYVLNDE